MKINKFRAYDSVSRYVFDVYKIDFINKIVYEQRGITFDNKPLFREHLMRSVVLLQCVGLTDKNSKDIYEGDIFKNADNKKFIVYYNDMECAFRQTTNFKNMGIIDSKYTDLPMNYNLKEIIGNMYENPELLNMEGTV